MRNFQLPGRSPVYAANGMAATSHPLATMTALQILMKGGNAMDAGLAACAVQGVVEPQSTGIGGDCFVLYAPGGKGPVVAYNGSGRAPLAASVACFREQGIESIGEHSPHAVTIPGAVDAWVRLAADHGTMGLDRLLQPAIRFARDGYPVHPRVAFDWGQAVDTLSHDRTTAAVYLKGGASPRPGDTHRQPLLARTLEKIAAEGKDGFYRGSVARDLVTYLRRMGGLHTLEDFEKAAGEYVVPISTRYGGYELFECPPNGQGITALIMLNLLSQLGRAQSGDPLSAERLHLEIEVARLAYQERNRYVTDPAKETVPVSALLSREHARHLGGFYNREKAMQRLPAVDLPESGLPSHGDTVYLCVVDRHHNAVSMINSIFQSFGSGLTGPESGVLLQNRGVSFCLDPSHANCIAPGKRPMHTIIPGMLKKEDRVVMPFGVMGGQYQPAGQVHVLSNMIDYGLDVQAAIDLARVFPLFEGDVEVEDGVPDAVRSDLTGRGHRLVRPEEPIGGGQAIWIDWERGVLIGGSDPRKDGCALGY
ncbi:MAG: gamma-glutamyltransferase [Deltaproteobacteria bacterium]|nr:gamma-glutamyltransferase [Deltaproteobacteria bacterium]